MSDEPLKPDHPLLNMSNVLVLLISPAGLGELLADGARQLRKISSDSHPDLCRCTW